MTYDLLQKHYSNLSDEDLLQIAGGGDDYRPEAVDAAKPELSSRGITLTKNLIDNAVAERKRDREELEADLVKNSGFDGALALVLAGRFREAGTAFRQALRHSMIRFLVVAGISIIIVLLALLLEHRS